MLALFLLLATPSQIVDVHTETEIHAAIDAFAVLAATDPIPQGYGVRLAEPVDIKAKIVVPPDLDHFRFDGQLVTLSDSGTALKTVFDVQAPGVTIENVAFINSSSKVVGTFVTTSKDAPIDDLTLRNNHVTGAGRLVAGGGGIFLQSGWTIVGNRWSGPTSVPPTGPFAIDLGPGNAHFVVGNLLANGAKAIVVRGQECVVTGNITSGMTIVVLSGTRDVVSGNAMGGGTLDTSLSGGKHTLTGNTGVETLSPTAFDDVLGGNTN